MTVDFVTGVFAQWLLEQLADAGRKRLSTFLLGDEQERAVRAAADAAIGLTAESFCPGGGRPAEHLAMVVDQVFAEPIPAASAVGHSTLLEALHAGIAAQLAPLDDAELTGTGKSSAELLSVLGANVAEQLARQLVQEIIGRGARGGPLAPLANQLDHDLTHLQGRALEAKLDLLISDVEETLREHRLGALAGLPEVAGWLGRSVDTWGALELEVHRPIVVDGAPEDIPEYIERGHDQQIRDALAGESAKLIVIVGGSSTGKTRAAYEAVRRQLSDWRLLYPIYPDKPRALVDFLKSKKIAPRTVIWLNELQQYLLPANGEEAAAAVREYLQSDNEITFVGTVWPEYWQELTQPSTGAEDPHPQSRALLLFAATRVDMAPEFPSDELGALADRDARIRMALQGGKDRITQYIAAGPALVQFFLDAEAMSPPVRAVLAAAMDYCLIEQYGQYSDCLPEFLGTAAIGYMSDEERGVLGENWLADALRRASVLLRGATRPLAPVRSIGSDSSAFRYRLADYLLQYARQHRFRAPIPASFWDGISAVLDSAYIPAFAAAADDRGMYQQSAQLWTPLAKDGDPAALVALLRNPEADGKSVERTAIEAIQHVDMDDIYTIGWMLIELYPYPDLRNRVVERIVAHPQELGVGEPLEMSTILEELRGSSHPEAADVYVRRIGELVERIDLRDFWSAASLVEELLQPALEAGRRAGLILANSLYESCRANAGQLAFLLRIISPEDPKLYGDGIRQLRLLIDGLQDVRDVISITPLLGNLKGLGEMGSYKKLRRRVCDSISTLTLGSSYAPLEMITLLRADGLVSAADDLSIRVAREYDPVISGATAHALRYLRPLMSENTFEVFANRMANEGPILPVAEADDVADCFTEMQMMGNRRVYLQRVRKFRIAEGN
jgi:hypothetical protein